MAINLLPQYNDLGEWQAFLEAFGAGDFVWAEDTGDQLAARTFNIQSLGTTIIVDREGRMVYRDDTASSYEMLRSGVLRSLD